MTGRNAIEFAILGILTIIIFPTNLNSESFIANAESEDNFDYALVFLTTWQSCSERNWDAMWYYESVTRQYLKMNGISGSGSIDCRNLDDLRTRLQLGAYDNKDLIVIIPDFWHSSNYIKSTGWLGHHTYYSDRPDIIMSNSFAIFNEDRAATWTLSHELMHFVIAYKDYGWNYQEDYVHKIDRLYDEVCVGHLEQCPHVYSTIKAPSGKLIPVMKPMPEPYKPNEKINTYISATVNGKGLASITNGQDDLCVKVRIHDLSGSPIISNAKLTVHTRVDSDDKDGWQYTESITTDSFGNGNICKYPFMLGVTDDVILHKIIEFDGNKKFKSSKSNLLIVMVDTPWAN